jgi:hemerythrin-like domain-containing protein
MQDFCQRLSHVVPWPASRSREAAGPGLRNGANPDRRSHAPAAEALECFLLSEPSMAVIGRPFSMTPSTILRHEHARLLGLAEALQRASERRTGAADPVFWRNAFETLRALAEHHHGKEEDALLAFLGMRGFTPATRPIAGLLADHREHDVLLDAVEAAFARVGSGGPWAETPLAIALERYRQHLDRHLEREEQTLLPLADRLSKADTRELMERFALYVELTGGDEAYTRLLESASEVERAALAAGAGHYREGGCADARGYARGQRKSRTPRRTPS